MDRLKRFCKFRRASVAVALAVLASQDVHATITFTNTPAVVGNYYAGAITLKIGGLNAGETVTVQKFLDINANGMVDATDPLVQQFPLTDGKAGMVIGGVINGMVPGDTDTIPGRITAAINLRAGGREQALIGRYLFVVSSPTARFTPVTNSFSVTNTSYGQSISGQVVNGGTSVPDALVLLMAMNTAGDYVLQTGVVADNSGHYAISPPSGTYKLFGAKAGFVMDVAGGPSISVNGGASITTNVPLSAATQSISGSTVDGVTTHGMGGLLITGLTANGFSMTFSDATGAFTLPSVRAIWELNSDATDVAFRGYLRDTPGVQVNTYLGSATQVLIEQEPVTAMYYGTIFDISGTPQPGINVLAWDDPNRSLASYGFADENGKYYLGVHGSLWTGNPWRIGPGSDPASADLTLLVLNLDQNGTDLAAGEALQADLLALPATNEITGTLRNSTGVPIAGARVYAVGGVSGLSAPIFGVDTDANGNFAFPVADGDWSVSVVCHGPADSLDAIIGSGAYSCPNSKDVTVSGTNATLHFTVALPGAELIYGNVVDSVSNYIAGVDVHFTRSDALGSELLVATTDTNGNYSVPAAQGRYWKTDLDCNQVGALGYICPVSQYADPVDDHSSEVDFVLLTCQPLAVGSGNVFLEDVGAFYTHPLANDGCYPPFSWSVTPGSALPQGIHLDSGGLNFIGGPTTNDIGTNVFSMRVTDATGATADGLVTIIVFSPPRIINSILPNATVGTPYYCKLGGVGGLEPLVDWQVSANYVPIDLDSSGVLGGTPELCGIYNFTVSALDSLGTPVKQGMSMVINGALTITPTSLPPASSGVYYSVQFQVFGGTPPYTWATDAFLPQPPGLLLGIDGHLFGIPPEDAYGTFSFVGYLSDFNRTRAIFELPLTINRPLIPPTISAPRRQSNGLFVFTVNGQAGQNYIIQFSPTLANWSTLLVTNSATASFQVADPLNGKARNYRVLVGP